MARGESRAPWGGSGVLALPGELWPGLAERWTSTLSLELRLTSSATSASLWLRWGAARRGGGWD